MSAPYPERATSISSSGHTDGLGRRALAFDRETGAMLERLYVRPELAAFESSIRQRVARLGEFDDAAFVQTCSAERDPISGELTVLSQFVAGVRLSEVLDNAGEQGLVPGVDVAVGYLLDALPALARLHDAVGFAHGLIDPARTLLSADGEVVYTDAAYGAVVERLGLSRRRLWTEFGIALPNASGPVRLDSAADVSQATLSAVMLVLGRTLSETDGPESLPGLLAEVVEVAQIRGSSAFATGIQRFLQRALPLPGQRPYVDAGEAVDDLRQAIGRELGVEACRQAFAEFVRQTAGAEADVEPVCEVADLSSDTTAVVEDDDEELSEETLRLLASLDEQERQAAQPAERAEGDPFEFDLELEDAAPAAALTDEIDDDEPVYELPALTLPVRPRKPLEEPPVADVRHDAPLGAGAVEIPATTAAPSQSGAEPSAAASSLFTLDYRVAPESLAPVTSLKGLPSGPEPPEATAAAPAAEPTQSAAAENEQKDAPSNGSRRKRQQQKSARARKDKLRSAASAKPEPAPPTSPDPSPSPAATAPAAPSKSGWLVPPDRAAKFDPPAGEPAPPPLSAPLQAPAHMVAAPFSTASAPPVYTPSQPVVSYQAPPMPPAQAVLPLPQLAPQPVYQAPATGIPMPRFATPPGGARTASPSPAPSQAPAASAGVVKLSTLKLKAEPPAGYEPTLKPRRPAPAHPVEPVAAIPHSHRVQRTEDADTKRFPWKLAIGFLVLVAAAIGAGRYYLPGRTAGTDTPDAAAEPAPRTVTAPMVQPKGTGQIVVVTQPAGARVLLDGTAAGESPVTLNAVPAGRHVLTLVSSSGSVKRTVKVVAGDSVEVEAPLFSGWLAVFAPVVLDVTENGKSLGSTEQGKLMISPGHHRLTLINRELAYSSEQEIDIAAGETSTVRLTPKGRVNFNAAPWAEVWLDGQKIGDTPIANYSLPLGSREFVFRNPQLGERRITATVRGDQPVAVSVDFNKPLQP